MPVITFKVSPQEARRIRAEARSGKRTVSALLRERVLATATAPRRRKLALKRHPVSGLPYNGTPGPAISQARIDSALADFP
jgi:hypothetical protein